MEPLLRHITPSAFIVQSEIVYVNAIHNSVVRRNIFHHSLDGIVHTAFGPLVWHHVESPLHAIEFAAYCCVDTTEQALCRRFRQHHAVRIVCRLLPTARKDFWGKHTDEVGICHKSGNLVRHHLVMGTLHQILVATRVIYSGKA